MEENSSLTKHPDNEIAYVTAKVNNVNIKFMIDTGANVSLIDINMYDKIQKEGKTSLPISNIILMGATGRQNKTIKRQEMCIRDRCQRVDRGALVLKLKLLFFK